jgi:hypothetical protein
MSQTERNGFGALEGSLITFNGVLNQTVREVECQSHRTQSSRRLGRLNLTGSSARVPSRFTVAHVDQQRRQPLV